MNVGKTIRSRISGATMAACGAVLLGGCDLGAIGIPPLGSEKLRVEVASVSQVTGSNAYIHRLTGEDIEARPGGKLYDGDGFRTGPATQMEILTIHGQSITIYENSDPFLKEAACFNVSFFKSGRIRIDASHVCVNGQYQQGSDVGYEALGPDVMRIWVNRGQVVALSNPAIVIYAGEGAVIAGGQQLRGPKTKHSTQEFEQRFPRIVNVNY